MAVASLTIKGGASLDLLLRELPGNVSRRVGANALRAGGRVIRDEARSIAPVETGELKASINVVTRRAQRRDQRRVTVGVAGKEGPLAHLIEFGSAPHRIVAKPGKKLSFVVNAEKVVVSEVSHPGTAPKPFLRPAADTKAGEAVRKIGETLGIGIEREAVKLAARLR